MEITEDNFSEHFIPVSHTYKPKKGQILARFRAMADLMDGWEKRQVINLLTKDRSQATLTGQKILQKLIGMPEKEASRLVSDISKDMEVHTEDEVAEKPYRFMMEKLYWTTKECVPNDPHWETINLIDVTTNRDSLNEQIKNLTFMEEE